MASKKSLAVALSRLPGFFKPKLHLEQYPTDSDIAATLLWQAHMDGNLQGTVVDLGAGTGILSAGALALDARVIAVEKDETCLPLLQEIGPDEIVIKDVKDVHVEADTVVMNPPFGAQHVHADKQFLEAAFRIAPHIYSIHNKDSEIFLTQEAAKHGYTISWLHHAKFLLKKTFTHQQRKHHRIDVLLVHFQKAP